ncbi:MULTISPECIES: hypothetical protein [Dyadobacter]|uniref:Uncharacterized protein n=1 Tax=Dyadobacter chenhuakuii TaxID=2909339 RepID=A0A9X1QHM2_9BACT|nr:MULTISPECIES: hypothetical protein [Dyadobacter]MCF2500433.1 hypothetical protein [Dyadobacter chenhuakuii]MCF2516026.1 hypothetical protein [Dyadobacter sp. CY351]
MDNFDKGVWNRLYYEGQHIAAELQPRLPGCRRRWAAIYKAGPTHPLSPWGEATYKYSVLAFELSEDLVDEYFSEEDKQNQVQIFAGSEADLIGILREQAIDPSLFTYPWKCDYPL